MLCVCPGGEIGRRIPLRWVRRKVWRFESSLGHIINNKNKMDLINKKCVPCEVGGLPLDSDAVAIFSRDLVDWKVIDNTKISRTFEFKNFRESIEFVNKIAQLAESEGHHPDITIKYNIVNIELMTHAVEGLTENDFIIATKINKIIN